MIDELVLGGAAFVCLVSMLVTILLSARSRATKAHAPSSRSSTACWGGT
jgi:hypothetical protein